MEVQPRQTVIYQAKNGQQPYVDWLDNLTDAKVKAAIFARIARLRLGLFGDSHTVGDEVSELRIHIGPGYRIYYSEINNQIVILLCGGDKSSQKKDIKTAKQYLEDYRRRTNAQDES
jgi:putative addiction module killer protein